MAIITTVVVIVLMRAGQPLFDDPRSLALLAFKFVVLNIGLFTFNLIPIPPLDGSKVIYSLLPHQLGLKYEAFVEKLSWLLMIVLFAGGARIVLAPIQRAIIGVLLDVVSFAT